MRAKPQKILVFCPNWVGDVVMATPALRGLRQHFPEAHLTALMRPYVAQTLAGNPWLDEVLLHDHRSAEPEQRTWNVIRQVRRRGFDTAVLLTNSIRTALIAWVGKIPRRVGYAREGRGLFLNDRLAVQKSSGRFKPSPVIDYYLNLVYHLGVPTQPYQMELFTSADDEKQADELWERFGFCSADRIVVLNPGAAFGAAKRWPSLYFSELARRLVDHHAVKALILCGPNERGFARFIADGSARPRLVKSMADQTLSIGLSKAIVRRAAMMVSTDSGPRHFAAAFGVPVVSLFGPTHIEWTETYFPKEIKLQQDVPCGPCQQRVCPLGHLRCMKELTVDRVYQAAVGLLEQHDARRAAG